MSLSQSILFAHWSFVKREIFSVDKRDGDAMVVAVVVVNDVETDVLIFRNVEKFTFRRFYFSAMFFQAWNDCFASTNDPSEENLTFYRKFTLLWADLATFSDLHSERLVPNHSYAVEARLILRGNFLVTGNEGSYRPLSKLVDCLSSKRKTVFNWLTDSSGPILTLPLLFSWRTQLFYRFNNVGAIRIYQIHQLQCDLCSLFAYKPFSWVFGLLICFQYSQSFGFKWLMLKFQNH